MSQASCLFCRIISGSLPAAKVYEDADFICIRDIQPQAKQHLLVIPRLHVESLDTAFPAGPEAGAAQTILVGKLFEAGVRVARQTGLLPAGFRSVINTNADGGQTVYHLHLHLLGGASLGESFG